MTTRSQRHRETALPFRYRNEGLEFELEQYSIDGRKPADFDRKSGQTELDLAPVLETDDQDSTADWDSLTLYGQITVPAATVEAVFPADEREAPPAKLYVAKRCHETIYRDRTSISPGPIEPETYEAKIRLFRGDLRGRVELRPYLVRTRERDGDGEYASQANFRVASGTIFTVVLDRPPGEEPPAIDGEEVSFSQASNLPDGEKLYYLDFRNESRPKLWINADHPRITDVLQSEGSVGAEPRMRDVILDQISYGVWAQLLVRAATALNEDGEVEHEWQETVLETFARNMYDVDDLAAAKHRLREDVANPDGLPHLFERLDRELQEFIEPRTQLINLMEEGLRI